jgi:hypothetical protein
VPIRVNIPAWKKQGGESELKAAIRLSGGRDEAAEIASLRAWLTAESEFRGKVEVDAHPPTSGEMGGGTDALLVSLGSGGAITVLISSLTNWLQARRSAHRRMP